MPPPSRPANTIAVNISASAPRRGRFGCDAGGLSTPGRPSSSRQIRWARPTRPLGGSARLSAMSLREWTVAGGLIETESGVLLVRNQRRGGFEDWSTPGGVIDAEDPDLLTGLSREV